MKCTNCGGRLEAGKMSFCPWCGVRQAIDLKEINFRDLGSDETMPCPHCCDPLDVIEFETETPVRIERCTKCFGMFFNPGELEYLLEQKTNPFVWLDFKGLDQIAVDYGSDRETRYLKCPMCAERMHHVNFGGRSGVILDQCGTHGVWVEGGELRRLMEWWRAGGKHIHQTHEAERAKKLYGEFDDEKRRSAARAAASSSDWVPSSPVYDTRTPDAMDLAEGLLDVLKSVLRW